MRGKHRKMKDFLKRTFDVKFLKFVLVGVTNTLVGMAIMYGSKYLLETFSQLGDDPIYWLSSGLNYGLTSILSYFLNKNFTFKHKGNSLASLLRFAINIIICWILAYGLAKPFTQWAMSSMFGTQYENITDNIAMLVGMGLFVFFNYFGQRFFAFRTNDDSASSEKGSTDKSKDKGNNKGNSKDKK